MQTGKPITTEEAPLLVDAAVALLTADRWLRLTMTTANGDAVDLTCYVDQMILRTEMEKLAKGMLGRLRAAQEPRKWTFRLPGEGNDE